MPVERAGEWLEDPPTRWSRVACWSVIGGQLLVLFGFVVIAFVQIPDEAAPAGPRCELSATERDLMQASYLSEREAEVRIDTWAECVDGPPMSATERAKQERAPAHGRFGTSGERAASEQLARSVTALDRRLLLLSALGFVLAAVHLVFHPRWRRAAMIAVVAAAVFVVAGLRQEDLLVTVVPEGKLAEVLEVPIDVLTFGLADAWRLGPFDQLRAASTVRLGLFLGLLPLFFISLALALGELGRNPHHVRNAPRPVRTMRTWLHRIRRGRPSVGSALPTWAPGQSEGPPAATSTPSTPVAEGRPLVEQMVFDGPARSPSPTAERGGPEPSTTGALEAEGSVAVEAEKMMLADRHSGTAGDDGPAADQASTVERTMAVCCSGGGIRSAAFNLGALQALDDRDGGSDRTPTQMDTVRWISAVSGGSYLAAAWVTARAAQDREQQKQSGSSTQASTEERRRPPAWSRLSPEEDHLRRNSQYLAPGTDGKALALSRYLVGLAVNLGLIGLVLLAVAIPMGWAVDHYDEPEPSASRSEVLLAGVGCIRFPDGRTEVLVSATDALRLGGDATVVVDPDVPAVVPATEQATTTSTLATTTTSPPTTGAPGGAPTSSTTTRSTRGTGCSKGFVLVGPTTGGPPGAGPDDEQVLSAGTEIGIVLGADGNAIPVTGRNVPTCSPGVRCRKGVGSRSQLIPAGSHLIRGPDVRLALRERSIVVVSPPGSGRLVLRDVCGRDSCKRTDRPWFVVLGVGLVLLTWGVLALSMTLSKQGSVSQQLSRWTPRFALLSVGAVLLLVVFPELVVMAQNQRSSFADRPEVVVGASTLTIALAVVSQVWAFVGGANEAAGRIRKGLGRVGAVLRPVLLKVAAVVAGPVLLLAVAVGIASWSAQRSGDATSVVVWIATMTALAVLWLGIDVNQWSLHSFYRNKLREAFATDPRNGPPPRDEYLSELPVPHPPTGGPDEEAVTGPELVICAAANIVDRRVTAPGRPVASWVFSRDEIGTRELQLRQGAPSDGSNGVFRPGDLPPTLRETLARTWTAVAVSGAAFSPAMGKMSRPERFLLAIANLRLGLWYPNPENIRTEASFESRLAYLRGRSEQDARQCRRAIDQERWDRTRARRALAPADPALRGPAQDAVERWRSSQLRLAVAAERAARSHGEAYALAWSGAAPITEADVELEAAAHAVADGRRDPRERPPVTVMRADLPERPDEVADQQAERWESENRRREKAHRRWATDAEERTSWYHHRQPSPLHLAREAIGSHGAEGRWMYVTDGGHYENLGLVEILRRRPSEIVCFDAAGDAPDTFGTLADAMRLARAELGIDVRIDPSPIKARAEDGADGPKDQSAFGVCLGTVHYPATHISGEPVEAKVGWIVLGKLTVPDKAPFDVRDLARTLDHFPTHPTVDQLYTDQKFEGYRALGQHIGFEAASLVRSLRSTIGETAGKPHDVVQAVDAVIAARLVGEAPAPPTSPPTTPAEEPAPEVVRTRPSPAPTRRARILDALHAVLDAVGSRDEPG